MLPIKGIQKTTLIDYPGKIASTIFIGGCNFKCPFCHNVSLVLEPDKLPNISEEEMLEYLRERKKYIDGICITGGEPTIYKELPQFIKKLKEIGYSIKLDTNGANPEMLAELIDNKIVDFVSMDIKAAKDKYPAAAGVNVELKKIEKSIALLKQGSVKYEFRTTVISRFFKPEDVDKIGKWLAGAENYYLQRFETRAGTLDPKFSQEEAYTNKELANLAAKLKKYIKKVEIRG